MNVVVLLAPGFEELEMVTIVDVLRRAGISVVLAGIVPPPIEGGHGIKVITDLSIDDVGTYDALVLPGGNPGYINLERDQRVLKLIREAYESGKYVGAICAAPHVLCLQESWKGRRRRAILASKLRARNVLMSGWCTLAGSSRARDREPPSTLLSTCLLYT